MIDASNRLDNDGKYDHTSMKIGMNRKIIHFIK